MSQNKTSLFLNIKLLNNKKKRENHDRQIFCRLINDSSTAVCMLIVSIRNFNILVLELIFIFINFKCKILFYVYHFPYVTPQNHF